MKKIIATDKAPAAIGPYSQGIAVGDLLFTSGQIPLDPATGEMVGTTIEEQAHQVFKNLGAILCQGGSDLDSIIKTTCFIKNMGDFAKVNSIYAEYLTDGTYPARSAIEVSELPKGALVEIEAVALIKK
ncbi:MAG: RidA family protein [Anaerovoracaceae bacterium]